MSANLREQFAVLPDYLGHHLFLTVVPLLLAVAISLPLGVLLARRRRLRGPVLALASVAQTIPGLALLALMVPLLVLLGKATTPMLGGALPALGWPPALMALTLYAVLPILRNTVTGLRGVDPALCEAARAMGMTPWQSLRQVELPLAAPVIVAGLRTATVWTVGTATLATPVGQTCLGNYIFMGLQTRNLTAVLFGSVAAAALAIFLDGLIGALETGVRKGSRRRVAVATALLAILLGAGLLAPWLSRAASGGEDSRQAWTVGAKTFTEQYILAALLEDTLGQAGLPVARREGLGSTVLFDALAAGQVDIYVDYSGTLWANHMKRKGGGRRREVLDQVSRWLQATHGILCLGPLGFENAYVLAMPRDEAARRGIRSVADLKRLGANLKIGGDYEFFGRPEWRSLRDTYGLAAATRTSYDSTFMYEAVARGEVDVISAFSSDGRIAAYDLVVLDEPQGVLPPYDALLLLSPQAAASDELVAALSPLIGAISADLMRQANNMVDRDDDPRTVREAAAWLAEQAGSKGAP